MCDVLLVEDNPIFRTSLKEMLAVRFPWIKIVEASDGEEALQKFNSNCPALIFMDIRLPGKNGLQITKMIKEADCDVEVAILTSHDNPEYRAAAMSSGASRFFAKGNAGSDEIADFVKSTLQRKGLGGQSC
jgi:DNA-binding NarL/FixJ family response regulator